MGGHGGLNILPQKKWNVYNFDNREKVRKDEEAAAKEEQLKREQSRRRDAELRLEKLRQAKGLESAPRPSSPSSPVRGDAGHINLFDGLVGFSALSGGASRSKDVDSEERKGRKEDKSLKRKREEKPVVVAPEDEKYRMGYGVAGKGVKAPWYLSQSNWAAGDDETEQEKGDERQKKASGKKTIEELRAERLKREKLEKERADALLESMRKKRHGTFRR